jgi:hypothetical protein
MFASFAGLLVVGLGDVPQSATAQITINHVIDLSGAVVENIGFGDYINKIYDFPASVQIGSGDSVDMTIMFASGQTVLMTDLGMGNESWVSGWLKQDINDPPNTSIFTIDNASVDLLDAGGNVIRSVFVGMDSSGETHIGPDALGVLNAGESLLVSGYHTYFDVVSLQNDPSHYSGPWLYMGADRLQITVPEPSTNVIMLAALGPFSVVAGRSRLVLRDRKRNFQTGQRRIRHHDGLIDRCVARCRQNVT